MWNDKLKDYYWWAEMCNQIQEFLWELSKAEDEESVDLYYMKLHFDNENDLSFFTEEERKEIKKRFSTLMIDTEKHIRLLNEIKKELKTLGESYACEIS